MLIETIQGKTDRCLFVLYCFSDNKIMDIQRLSIDTAQIRVQEEAAVRVQAMALQTIKDTAADLTRLIDSAVKISDPAKGNYLNMFM